jgi:hypothetical protein
VVVKVAQEALAPAVAGALVVGAAGGEAAADAAGAGEVTEAPGAVEATGGMVVVGPACGLHPPSTTARINAGSTPPDLCIPTSKDKPGHQKLFL